MARSGHPGSGFPLSRRELAKFTQSGPMREFLDYYASRDLVVSFDDFLGDTINLDMYAVANGGGASAASFATNVQVNGVIRATSGTAGDDTASASLITPANWYGDLNASVECRWKLVGAAVTETKVEIGFVDVVPGSNKSVINSLVTPTVNTAVVDAALDTYRHASSTTTNELATIGSSITAAKTTFTPVNTVASAVYSTTRIMIMTNFVKLWRDGVEVASHSAAATDYIEGTNPVAFWAYLAASNSTSKNLDIDYIRLAQDRS